jgi:hypothetical protein
VCATLRCDVGIEEIEASSTSMPLPYWPMAIGATRQAKDASQHRLGPALRRDAVANGLERRAPAARNARNCLKPSNTAGSASMR